MVGEEKSSSNNEAFNAGVAKLNALDTLQSLKLFKEKENEMQGLLQEIEYMRKQCSRGVLRKRDFKIMQQI